MLQLIVQKPSPSFLFFIRFMPWWIFLQTVYPFTVWFPLGSTANVIFLSVELGIEIPRLCFSGNWVTLLECRWSLSGYKHPSKATSRCGVYIPHGYPEWLRRTVAYTHRPNACLEFVTGRLACHCVSAGSVFIDLPMYGSHGFELRRT